MALRYMQPHETCFPVVTLALVPENNLYNLYSYCLALKVIIPIFSFPTKKLFLYFHHAVLLNRLHVDCLNSSVH